MNWKLGASGFCNRSGKSDLPACSICKMSMNYSGHLLFPFAQDLFPSSSSLGIQEVELTLLPFSTLKQQRLAYALHWANLSFWLTFCPSRWQRLFSMGIGWGCGSGIATILSTSWREPDRKLRTTRAVGHTH